MLLGIYYNILFVINFYQKDIKLKISTNNDNNYYFF